MVPWGVVICPLGASVFPPAVGECGPSSIRVFLFCLLLQRKLKNADFHVKSLPCWYFKDFDTSVGQL